MVKTMKLQLFYHMTKIDCASSHHEQFNQIIHQSHIIITGNNNHVSMHFDSEENVEKLLLNEGLIIKNIFKTIILRYSSILGIIKLIIRLPGLGAGVLKLPIIVDDVVINS